MTKWCTLPVVAGQDAHQLPNLCWSHLGEGAHRVGESPDGQTAIIDHLVEMVRTVLLQQYLHDYAKSKNVLI